MIFAKLFSNTSALKVKPVHEISHAGKKWLSTGSDPHFEVLLGLKSLGWYEFSVGLDMEYDFQSCRLYFDFGEGFTEKGSISLTVESGIPATRFFYLDQTPLRIRFDPMSSAGLFEIIDLSISPARGPVVDIVFERLVKRHKNFKGMTYPEVKTEIGRLAKKRRIDETGLIASFYDTTFVTMASPSNSYMKWLIEVEERQSKRMQTFVNNGFAYNPLISILVPVYNPGPDLLKAMVESVLNQTYRNLQLCIADDCSTDPEVILTLKRLAETDERIDLVLRAENGHISRTTNDALATARGEYCALLDHDDLLHKHALAHVVHHINLNPNVKVLYSDEDKVDVIGNRYDPHFKSGWNPDLLHSQNYISHLGVYQNELINAVGGFRIGYEGSQDYDLTLRCTEKCQKEEIVHIPHILYHWRAVEGSTALSSDEKSYTEDASIKALNSHFERLKQPVNVESGLMPNTFHCAWKIPKPAPLISLLIPTRDGVEVLEQCVTSILDRTTYRPYEIIILNNQSTKKTTYEYFDSLAKETRVRVLDYDQPFNFSAINNYGALFAKGDVIGFINNDLEIISDDWLTEMVGHALRPEIGCVGAKLYFENNTIQHAGVITGIGGVAGHSHKYFERDDPGYFCRLKLVQNYSAVTAAALLIRKEVYLEVGGLRESLQVAFNDVDFCLKVDRAGYRNLWTPYAEMYHYESVSRGTDESGEKKLRFDREIAQMKKIWGEKLDNDPYYNPNLTKIHENFELHIP